MGVAMRLGLGVGLLAVAAAGQQKDMPDAQVESNVLRALAGAPELSTQDIHTTTVYGVVTLSGSAADEASRTKAENLAARAEGVKKVIDELTLAGSGGGQTSASESQGPPLSSEAASGNGAGQSQPLVLQSDGTYAPAASQGASSEQETSSDPQGQTVPQSSPQQQAPAPYDTANNAPQPPAYPPANQRPYPQRRPMYGDPNGPNGYAQRGDAYPVQGGQVAGRPVTVPSGALLRIRISQGLNTKHSQPGEVFDGIVLSDVTADGAVAIPRGAAVQGTVVDVHDAGALKGRGELALQLTRLTMGGQVYTLTSDVWKEHGSDKTVRTVDSALGLGALGAIFGGVAGGGAGAAIGAGVGAGAGVASSAASPGGKVIIPPEAVLTFHLAQATTVATVSEQEMSRLSYAAGPGYGQPVARRRVYVQPYYGPYGPYGPYYGPRY